MSLTRRRLLAGGARLLSGGAAAMLIRPDGGYSQAAAPIPDGVFTLGVASGDPLPDGVVLWTRLAPQPSTGGGMPDRVVTVEWEIAADETFGTVRRTGTADARPELAHSVHVDVRGLAPDTYYWYRFRVGGQISPTGRTRTAPAAGSSPRGLRFAFASCQDYQSGYYTAWAHLADEDLRFVAFLGDYIYEGPRDPTAIRQYEGTGEPRTLAEYRDRHGTVRTDPHLQDAHARFPWIVTLDDHEVDNNWAGLHDPDGSSAASFRARRIAAFQAYYEHMPLRRSSLPRGLDMQLYRRLSFGTLAEFHVLDTRQYRSVQPSTPAEAADPGRTMTGPAQEKWLTDGLRTSGARWNLLANQVMWAQHDRADYDAWDGYRAQRTRLLTFFADARVSNPVVLTGDRHCTWVSDLRPDFDDPSTPVVAAEILGTSITSGGNANVRAFHATWDRRMRDNPHWRYIDNRRGYVVCHLDDAALTSDLRVVDTVTAPAAAVRTEARFTVEAGRPGVAEVTEAAAALMTPRGGPSYNISDDLPGR